MRKIESLIFIPKNAKLMKRSILFSDSELLPLEEKIRRNPSQRERYICEYKILNQMNNIETPKRNKRRKRKGKPEELITDDRSNNSEEYDDGSPKDYIKNMTANPIILATQIFSGADQNSRGGAKAKVLKHFMAKYELTEEELNSPAMKKLYSSNSIKDVTENQMKIEMVDIKKRDTFEKIKGVKSISGAGGVTMRDVNGSVDDILSGSDDSGVIHFDVGSSGGGKSREEVEMDRLAGGQRGGSGEATDVSDIKFSDGLD